jgi:DDE superfamily endonuclease
MEDILSVYERPADERFPLVCLDEFCKQLLGEVTAPLPVKTGAPPRHDYEYVREGSATAFMVYAPLLGIRRIIISEDATRTALDYAEVLRLISHEMFPGAEKIVLVEDNLNTHTDASLYAAFNPRQARSLAECFERHHTPKHGSWLNIAESEISATLRTGIAPRVASADEFRQQCHAIEQRRNRECRKTDWQFTCEASRLKLKSLYPSFQN